MKPATAQVDRDIRLLQRFVQVYCRDHHGTDGRQLCPECADLVAYAETRRRKCRLDPKPKCKDCTIHCYRPAYREKIRAVMRYSGMYFIKRGRVDYLFHYFF